MNFREAFIARVFDFISNHIEDRTERVSAIKTLITEYTESYGENPPTVTLDALADYVLYEEIHDPHPDKMTRNEYPIMSARQEGSRRDREYSISLADNYDTDGTNRAKPERRHRTAKEHRFVEKVSQSKNRMRNAQYKRDTAAGALITYNLRDYGGELTEPFVAAQSVAETWRDHLSTVY